MFLFMPLIAVCSVIQIFSITTAVCFNFSGIINVLVLPCFLPFQVGKTYFFTKKCGIRPSAYGERQFAYDERRSCLIFCRQKITHEVIF